MDGDDAPPSASRLFGEPAKIWDSTKITTFSDGHWALFLDGGQQLNSPRLQKIDLRIPYRHKGYRPSEPRPPPDPLSTPKNDNYTAFRAPRRIYPARAVQSVRDRDANWSEFDDPGDIYTPTFHGDRSSRSPFRRSIQLINEKRLHDARPEPPTTQTRVVRLSRPSLFTRSIKFRKKKTVWPPDDYFS
jgi:hypothetical protein